MNTKPKVQRLQNNLKQLLQNGIMLKISILYLLIILYGCASYKNNTSIIVYTFGERAINITGIGDLNKKFFRVATVKKCTNDKKIISEYKYILKLVKKRGRIITKKRYDDNELFKYIIKNGLPKNEYLDNQPYQIAIIYQKDTLYTNTHLNIWRWNNEKSYNYYHSNVFAKLIY